MNMQGGDIYSHTQPQPPHATYTRPKQYFDPRSPAYPAPNYQPSYESIQRAARAAPPTPTTHIRQIVHDRAVQENHRRIAEDILERGVDALGRFDSANYGEPIANSDSTSAPPKSSYDSTGFEADMDVSEEEPVFCGAARVVGYQASVRNA
jgi:hypothetical protein